MRYGVAQIPGHQADGYVPNEYYMNLAIEEAIQCIPRGQHPVGAIVTRTMEIYSVDEQRKVVREFVAGIGANAVEGCSMQHAEVAAIQQAETHHGRHKLQEMKAVLYTTHEPCPMCAGLIANSKLSGVVFGTSAEDARELVNRQGIKWRSNAVSGIDIILGRQENGMPEQFVTGGFMRDKCLELLGKVTLLGGSKAVASVE